MQAFDASSMIYARDNYPVRQFLGLWDWMAEQIEPDEIRKKCKVPKNGSIFFTILQTFMSGYNDTPYFGEYPPDFFDCIIIDECHRGGANGESNWRGILEYFSPAVQLGLTPLEIGQASAGFQQYLYQQQMSA